MRTAAALIATGLLLAAGIPAQAEVLDPRFSDTPVATGFSAPTALAFLPDGTILVTEKGGDLESFDGTSKTTVGNLGVCTASEMGLLGIAIDPGFTDNHYVYLFRTAPTEPGGCASSDTRRNQVVRVTLAPDGKSIVEDSLVELIPDLAADAGNHNAGGLRIGPDEKLWVSTGDAGSGAHIYPQNLNRIEGKLLRIELDGGVPDDNPYAGSLDHRGEIYAYGFRNPFRFGFDPVTGRAWVGDVGAGTQEEIDVILRAADYGWPDCEGTFGDCGGRAAPAFSYPHSGPTSLGRTVIGGAFADFGAGYDYYFSDYIADRIYRAPLNNTRFLFSASPTTVIDGAGGAVDLIRGPDGTIYYTALSTGEVRRLSGSGLTPEPPPAGGGDPPAPQNPGSAADKAAPHVKLSARRRQSLKRLSVRVAVDEAATVVGTGSVRVPEASKLYRFKTVRRTVTGEKSVRIRFVLKRKAKRSVGRALRNSKLAAKLRLTVTDRAGNSRRLKRTIRLAR